MATINNSLTDIPGIRVGHAQDDEALTGCTVILCEAGAVAGVDVRGGAPGTRETDALHPLHLVKQVHAVVLAGGSAFGLDAASGAARYLEERGVGFDVGVTKVPIVPAAILFDLGIGRADVRPDAAMGYQACLNATDRPPALGNAGVGTGATVGKVLGMGQAMKSGIGMSGVDLGGGVIVAALAAVNAFGDVVDPQRAEIIAGARSFEMQGSRVGRGSLFADTLWVLTQGAAGSGLHFGGVQPPLVNTVIGVVATNARLDKEQVTKVAQMAHDGLARAIRPAHTMFDGDTIFALSLGERSLDVNVAGAFAAEVFAAAIVSAVRSAQGAAGLPGARDL